jgi:hypothetical protein
LRDRNLPVYSYLQSWEKECHKAEVRLKGSSEPLPPTLEATFYLMLPGPFLAESLALKS